MAAPNPANEAALLPLLRMKCGLLSLHPLNQLFDSINGWLICDPPRQETVVFDLRVDALFAHCFTRLCQAPSN
jgi:hypothetical protein